MRRDRRRRTTWALVGVTAALPGRLEVQWEAPAGCPSAAEASRTIRARVGDALGDRHVQARVQIREREGAWWVTVELDSDDGPLGLRSLSAPSCEEALTATAVVIAIAVDPTAAPTEREPAEDPTRSVPGLVPEPTLDDHGAEESGDSAPTTREGSASDDGPGTRAPAGEAATDDAGARRDEPGPRIASRGNDPSPPRSPPAPLGLSLGVRGGVEVGPLASTAGHLAGAAGLFGQRWHVYAGALHRIRADVDVPLPQDAGGRFRVTAGQVGAGPRLDWGAFELPLSGGLEVGALWARGIGAVDPIRVRRLWLAAVARASATLVPVEAFAVQLGVDGVVPLLRPTFTLNPTTEVLTVGPFAFRAWLAVQVRFFFERSGSAGKGT